MRSIRISSIGSGGQRAFVLVPGIGVSSNYFERLAPNLSEFGIVDPVIVGHSMGTQVVADLASRRSDLTTIVLIGPVVDAAERRVPLAGLRFLQSSWHEPWRVKILACSAYLLCGVKWFSRILPEMMRFPIEDRVAGIMASTLIIRGESTPSPLDRGSSTSEPSSRPPGSGRSPRRRTPSCTPTPRRWRSSASTTRVRWPNRE